MSWQVHEYKILITFIKKIKLKNLTKKFIKFELDFSLMVWAQLLFAKIWTYLMVVEM